MTKAHQSSGHEIWAEGGTSNCSLARVWRSAIPLILLTVPLSGCSGKKRDFASTADVMAETSADNPSGAGAVNSGGRANDDASEARELPGASIDTPMLAGGGRCDADAGCQCNDEVQSCAPLPLCDGGVACGPGAACTGCFIDGDCVAAGSSNPTNPCQVCDSVRSATDWSDADGSTCDDGIFCTEGDNCQAGECVGIARTCDDGVACNGVSTCDETAKACAPGQSQCGANSLCDVNTGMCVSTCAGCIVSGACVAAGDVEPGNPCHVCDPLQSTTAFSPAAGKSCGSPPGVCSGQDTCDAQGECQPNDFTDGTACGNPASSSCDGPDTCDGRGACQLRVLPNATPCDDGRFCTVGDSCQGGVCSPTGNRNCGDGLACNEDTAQCQCQGCIINSQCIASAAVNPANECESCDPSRSTTTFSTATDPLCGSCPRRWGAAVQLGGAPEGAFQGTMTADLLRLCFASDQEGGLGNTDIWCATRADVSQAFGAAVNQGSVNSTSSDRMPALSADGTELVFSSNRGGSGGAFDLYRSLFVPAAGAFGDPTPLTTINTTRLELGADLSRDGLNLYFQSRRDSEATESDIFVATRPSRNADFAPPVAVTGLSTLEVEEEPGLCAGQSFMTFCSSNRPPGAGESLWGAPRLSSGGFGPQAPLDVGLPSDGARPCGPSVLSDGSLLFQMHVPADGPNHLFVAPPLP